MFVAVSAGVPDGVGAIVDEGVPVSVKEADEVGEIVPVWVLSDDPVEVPEVEGVPDTVGVFGGVPLDDDVPEGVPLGDPELEGVPEVDAVSVGVPVVGGVTVGERVMGGVPAGDGVTAEEGVGVCDADGSIVSRRSRWLCVSTKYTFSPGPSASPNGELSAAVVARTLS